MTILKNLETTNPFLAADIKTGLQPIRVGPRTIHALRRSWTIHDIAVIDLILQELGCRIITTRSNDVDTLFAVVPVPISERPPISGDTPCETCGHWSSQLLQGMCPSCRERFHLNGEQSDG